MASKLQCSCIASVIIYTTIELQVSFQLDIRVCWYFFLSIVVHYLKIGRLYK